MSKVSEILKNMIRNDQQLEFFLANQLLNLSRFARFIQPLVSVQMQEEVNLSAIVMALSRLQRKSYLKRERPRFRLKEIRVHTGLCTMSFNKSDEIHMEMQQLYRAAKEANAYFMISESGSEITFISKYEFIETQSISRPKYQHLQLAAISIQFDPKYLETPGIITTILQKLTLQNINFIEIASTCTEITIFVDDTDVKLAFDTLHDSFFS